MSDDAALLRAFTASGDQQAFRDLVARKLDLVYASALRRVGGDAHLAQDVAQQVFAALAANASRVSAHPEITGWLFHTTRHVAANCVRAERRRKLREQKAIAMEESCRPEPTSLDWNQLAPLLDGALDRLGETDRAAVLLRCLERRSFAEIAAVLRVSEDAARKRVERGLDRLRLALRRRGIKSTASALACALTAGSATAAPAGLVATIAAAALGSASAKIVSAGLLAGSKLQVAAVVVLAAAAGLVWIWPHALPREMARSTAVEREPAFGGTSLIVSDRMSTGARPQSTISESAADAVTPAAREGASRFLETRSPRAIESRSGDRRSRPNVHQVSNLGRATPASAIVTAQWAMIEGRSDLLASAIYLDAATRQEAENQIGRLTEAQRARFPTPEDLVALLMCRGGKSLKEISNVEIVSQERVDENHSLVGIRATSLEGKSLQGTYTMARLPDGWRWSLSVPFAQRVLSVLAQDSLDE